MLTVSRLLFHVCCLKFIGSSSQSAMVNFQYHIFSFKCIVQLQVVVLSFQFQVDCFRFYRFKFSVSNIIVTRSLFQI